MWHSGCQKCQRGRHRRNQRPLVRCGHQRHQDFAGPAGGGFYAERQSQFTQAMADMGHQFWTSDGRLSMIGQGRNVVVLILLVFLVAAICARGRQLKLRIGCIGVLSLACFVGITSCWRSAMALFSSRIRPWAGGL